MLFRKIDLSDSDAITVNIYINYTLVGGFCFNKRYIYGKKMYKNVLKKYISYVQILFDNKS